MHMRDHAGPESPAWTATTQEPYYSNQDIGILHEIVTSAQDNLDNLDGPRPLPATALFKAYDEILPKHNIDPDDDNHLSRLIFRVGGERGSASLPDKFKNVLASMGISLEFGDGSPASVQETQSTRSTFDDDDDDDDDDDAEKNSEINTNESDLQQNPDDGKEPNFAPPILPEYDAELVEIERRPSDISVQSSRRTHNLQVKKHPADLRQQNAGLEQPLKGLYLSSQDIAHSTGPARENIDEPLEADTNFPLVRSALPQPPVLAIIDRWRKRSKDVDKPLELSHRFMGTKPVELHGAEQAAKSSDAKKSQLFSTENPPPTSQRQAAWENPDQQLETARLPTPPAPIPQLTQKQTGEQRGDYSSILQRAGRAREIYLASRTFNHWAERTAARLEKEAVARRHMIRFRCFTGWSQAPNSRWPAVDHLRTVTAVQKLQRAVACQEEQLRVAASTIAESYRIQTAKRVMSQWLCSITQQRILHNKAHNTRRNIANAWEKLAAAQSKLAESTTATRFHLLSQRFVDHWASQTQHAAEQLAMGKHANLVRSSLTHLEAWLGHSEVQKRAETYHANRLWLRARFLLNHWNLRTRTQAFTWRSDYQNVTSALDKWSVSTRSARVLTHNAAVYNCRYSASQVLHQSEDFDSYTHRLENYANRARLYIMAKKFLHVLDHTYEARKWSRKEEIRQQLRARYKEASSARKKRQFYSALERWRSSSRENASLDAKAGEHDARQRAAINLAMVQSWAAAAQRHAEHHLAGQKHAANGVLAKWAQMSGQLAEQETESWDSWMQRNQWQTLKSWSISSLQGSGRAHTAAMVRHRYEADKRTRAFSSWKATCFKVTATDPSHTSATPRFYPGFSGRSSWRALSSRQPSKLRKAEMKKLNTFGASTAQLETPTRWTGRALAMSNSVARPMAPVKEADEQSLTASSVGDEVDMDHDFALGRTSTGQGLGRSLVMRPLTVVSTTPRAPVPVPRGSVHARRPAVNNSLPSALSGQSFSQSTNAGGLPQSTREASQGGYVDSAIQTSNVSRTERGSQNPSVSNWQGPATPSRATHGLAATRETNHSTQRTKTAKTAPLPSRIHSQRQHDSRALRGSSNQISSTTSVGHWQ